jgi:putative N6-adenine-specific DNA methylase
MKHLDDAALVGGTERSRILITCPKRIPTYLARELDALEFPIAEEAPAGVVTSGTMHDAYKLNLHIRTGHRVLFQLRKFYVRTPDDLFKSLSTIAWEDIIPEDGYVSVVSSVDTASITNTMFANVKCKDAIVDRIRTKRGVRPDSGSDTSKAVVFLYWKDLHCFVYLDTSGEPLSKRGYRTMPGSAPMRETLVASTLMATRWDAASAFVNPMCGSGTIAIEAAQVALHQAPGLMRTNFGFMHLCGYSPETWERLRAEAKADMLTELPFPIIASDLREEAIFAAQHNAKAAGVEKFITFQTCDFAETEIPPVLDGTQPVVMLNPEYGERMGDMDTLEPVYKGIGDFFKQKCRGYMGYIFTGNPDLAKKIGLKTIRRHEFYNSDIDCRLLEYELYGGTRRVFTEGSTEKSAQKVL